MRSLVDALKARWQNRSISLLACEPLRLIDISLAIKVEAFPYKRIRDRIEDKTQRKLFDEILGDDGWMVSVEEDGYPLSERTILIRVKNDRAAVVAGPLKQNQITPCLRPPRMRYPGPCAKIITEDG